MGHREAVYRPQYQAVAEQVVELIADEGLQVGDRLPTERELAIRYSVSRNVVREAVRALVATGRVTSRKGVGIAVAEPLADLAADAATPFQPLDPAHVEQLFVARRPLEMAVAQAAARAAAPARVSALLRHAHASVEAAAAGDRDRFGAEDAAFHDAVAAASANMFLTAALRSCRDASRRVNAHLVARSDLSELRRAGSEHVAIAEAIRDGDVDRAAAAAHAHVASTRAEHIVRLERTWAASVPPGSTAATP